MTQISSNSELFPAPPLVTLDIPEDWTGVPSPGAMLAARGTLVDNRAPIVAVRYSTQPLNYRLADALQELRNFAAQQNEGEMDEPFRVEINGVEMVGVNLSWVEPKIGPIVQIHMFAGTRTGGLVRMIHVTGTVGGDTVEADYDTVQAVLQTLRIEESSR